MVRMESLFHNYYEHTKDNGQAEMSLFLVESLPTSCVLCTKFIK